MEKTNILLFNYLTHLKRKYTIQSFLLIITFLFLNIGCDLLYAPKEQLYPNQGTSQIVKSGTIYSINLGQQVCNPSISPDTANFPDCMLWLGFSGQFVVNVPDSLSDYTTTDIDEHDRLTITDTSNTVRWYIMRDRLSITGHIQDPEWSTHPDYLTCLGNDAAGMWDGYAVRIPDKAHLKFCENKMIIDATPHLWVNDTGSLGNIVTTPEYDTSTGLIKKQYIEEFFGTAEVKIVYALRENGLTLFYIDYSQIDPKPVPLLKPEGMENWNCESPLISSEGNWIAFNCYIDLFAYKSYIQRLQPGSLPILIAANATDPHWWIDPVDQSHPYYIVFARLAGSYVVGADLTNPSVEENGSAGITMKQRLRGSPLDVPVHMGLKVNEAFPAIKIAGLPFKGGLSKDGRFLCTAYIYSYMLLLP